MSDGHKRQYARDRRGAVAGSDKSGRIARRMFMGLLGMAMTMLPVFARGQQSAKPVIGILSTRSSAESAALVAALRKGLAESGFREGENLTLLYRWAENTYSRLPGLAAELLDQQVSLVIAAGGPAAAFAAKKATSTIPIVFTSVGNPVEIGLVTSLNRPGGNITGFDATLTVELDAKRLELLHELVPKLASVGVLVNPKRPQSSSQIEAIKSAAAGLGLETVFLNAPEDGNLARVFLALPEQGSRALLVTADPLFASRREQLVGLASRYHVPAIYQWREFAIAGGLISYGASLPDAYRQAGVYASRILKGENPADLPVARPTKFELVVNLRTARALNLTVPQSLLARADEVIE